MKNIVKSQFYQIIREKILWYMLVVALFMQTLMFMLPIWLENEEATSAGEFFAEQGNGLIFFPLFFLIVAVGQICGTDFLDKTNHYEVLGGHRRHEVYLGRVIPALLVGGLGSLLLSVLPVVLYTIMFGWGTKIPLGAVLLRFIMLLFPFLRLVCEFVFITFLVKNPYVMMGVGYLVFIAIMGLSEILNAFNAFLGITNMMQLLVVEKWVTFGLGGDLNYIYEAPLNAGVIVQTILASVVFGVGSLYLGYIYFKNNDLN
ncbi:MAG: hypothetical protein IKL22_01875 [Lachnospiraceae bacterium]|nr:hypothetical protein [Lachnospiraceae bacterium]